MGSNVCDQNDTSAGVNGGPAHAPASEAVTFRPTASKLPPARALAWSLVLNVIFVGVFGFWVARRLASPGRPDGLQRMRADHFHDLVRGSKGADIVMLGDSNIQFAEWSELMNRPVANRGIAGDTIDDVRQRLEDVVVLRPKILFLLVGCNDLQRGATPQEVAQKHSALVRELQARLPTTRLVVQALLPIHRPQRTSPAAIAETNALLARAAEAEGVAFLDVGRALEDPTGQLDPRYSLDGLHVSGEGYRVWANMLLPLPP